MEQVLRLFFLKLNEANMLKMEKTDKSYTFKSNYTFTKSLLASAISCIFPPPPAALSSVVCLCCCSNICNREVFQLTYISRLNEVREEAGEGWSLKKKSTDNRDV